MLFATCDSVWFQKISIPAPPTPPEFPFFRASDRVRKKITNYAEIFRNIMRKKVSIIRKTSWIMRKIFGSLQLPKITSFHAAEIELPPKSRVCLQANFKPKNIYWYLGFSSYVHLTVFGMLRNNLINYM